MFCGSQGVVSKLNIVHPETISRHNELTIVGPADHGIKLFAQGIDLPAIRLTV